MEAPHFAEISEERNDDPAEERNDGPTEPVTAFGVWARAFDAIRAQPLAYLGLSLVPGGVSYLFMWMSFGQEPWLVVGVSLIGQLASHALTQVAIATGVASYLNGSPRPWSSMAAQGVRRLPVAMLAFLVAAAFVSLGSLLLFIPGLILMMALTPVAGVVGLEGLGPMQSLRRALDLTKGHRWTMFRVWLLYWVGAMLLEFSAFFATMFFTGTFAAGALLTLGAFVAVRLITVGVLCALVGAAYHALKGTPRVPLPTRF